MEVLARAGRLKNLMLAQPNFSPGRNVGLGRRSDEIFNETKFYLRQRRNYAEIWAETRHVIATKFQPEEVSYTGINLCFITACASFVYSEGMTFVNYMLF